MGHKYTVAIRPPEDRRQRARMAEEAATIEVKGKEAAASSQQENRGKETEVVVGGVIKNITTGRQLKLQSNKDWSGRIDLPYPGHIVKGGSGGFVHVAVCHDKAAVVYAGWSVDDQFAQMNCAWLLAWSVQVADPCHGHKKVYVEAGDIINYIKVDWDDIHGKLDKSSNRSHYLDQSTGCEAFAQIDGQGEKATVVAFFNVNLDVVQVATGAQSTGAQLRMGFRDDLRTGHSALGAHPTPTVNPESSSRNERRQFSVRGLIKNKTYSHICLQNAKIWSGRLQAPYPPNIVQRGAGRFNHVGERSDKAAMVYAGSNAPGLDRLNCAWLLAWSVQFSEDGCNPTNKVYVEAGDVVKYIGIDWDDIQDKLDQSVDQSRYCDQTTGCQAFANINMRDDNDIEVVAVFDIHE